MQCSLAHSTHRVHPERVFQLFTEIYCGRIKWLLLIFSNVVREKILDKQSTCYCWMKTDQKLLINMKKKCFPFNFRDHRAQRHHFNWISANLGKMCVWTPIAHWAGARWELQLATKFQWIIAAWMIGKPLIRLHWWLLTSLKSVVASTQDSQPT